MRLYTYNERDFAISKSSHNSDIVLELLVKGDPYCISLLHHRGFVWHNEALGVGWCGNILNIETGEAVQEFQRSLSLSILIHNVCKKMIEREEVWQLLETSNFIDRWFADNTRERD